MEQLRQYHWRYSWNGSSSPVFVFLEKSKYNILFYFFYCSVIVNRSRTPCMESIRKVLRNKVEWRNEVKREKEILLEMFLATFWSNLKEYTMLFSDLFIETFSVFIYISASKNSQISVVLLQKFNDVQG